MTTSFLSSKNSDSMSPTKASNFPTWYKIKCMVEQLDLIMQPRDNDQVTELCIPLINKLHCSLFTDMETAEAAHTEFGVALQAHQNAKRLYASSTTDTDNFQELFKAGKLLASLAIKVHLQEVIPSKRIQEAVNVITMLMQAKGVSQGEIDYFSKKVMNI